MDHHPGRKAHEAGTAIRLGGDHAADAQLGIAQAHQVAHLQRERIQQGGIHPGLAARRNLGGGRARLTR